MNAGPEEAPRPRLLLAMPFFHPNHYGGAVEIYHQLLTHLRRFDPVVVSQRVGGDAAKMEQFDQSCAAKYGYRCRRIERFELIFPERAAFLQRLRDSARFFRQTPREWRKVIRDVDPDVIVCGATLYTGWLVKRIPAGIPFVNYLHGEELGAVGRRRSIRRYMFSRQLQSIRDADLNIAVSRFTAQRACELAGIASDRVVLLPNFVDLGRFSPPADRERSRRQLGWEGRKVILTLARLTPRKGIDQAVRALAELRRAGQLSPEWIHVIAGRGEQEGQLRALVAQLGADDYTRFQGFVPTSDVPSYYGSADIFLQPNRDLSGDTEGFGVVFLEASACRTAVIGGIAGGTADAIRDGVTGFRVDSEDIAAIGQAVMQLANNEELRCRMGTAGYEMVHNEHRLEVAVSRFEELLLQVVAQRPVSRARTTPA